MNITQVFSMLETKLAKYARLTSEVEFLFEAVEYRLSYDKGSIFVLIEHEVDFDQCCCYCHAKHFKRFDFNINSEQFFDKLQKAIEELISSLKEKDSRCKPSKVLIEFVENL